MQNMGAVIRQLRRTRGVGLEELAKHVGVAFSTLARKERGEADFTDKELKAMLKYLDASDIYESWSKQVSDQAHAAVRDTKPSKGIPVINAAPAGRIEDYETDHYDEYETAWAYVERGDVKDPKAFAVVVVGDSMEPNLHEGDVLICSPVLEFEEEKLRDGAAVFVRFSQDQRGGCLLARLFHEKGGKVRLAKDNPKYKSKVYPLDSEHIARIAVAIEKRSKRI